MRIVSVVGARPNLMKIAPIVASMNRTADISPILVHTGQHYDDNMSKVFFRDLGIPEPDHYLGIGGGSHTQQTARIMLALEPILMDLQPDFALAVGDVNSTLATALVAAKLQIPVVHVEAGLRSFDRTMPEEINRILTDSVSDWLFTTEASANVNLEREGVASDRIFFVGNVMIDTLLTHKQQALDLHMPQRLGAESGRYGVVTLHRPSNVDDRKVFANILKALSAIQREIPIFFPVHPRTRQRLMEFGFKEELDSLKQVVLLDPMGYLEFLGLTAEARIVLTDSGGIQEETTILGVPCLTLRENTERPVTIEQGTNQLVGTSTEAIIRAAEPILRGETKQYGTPELWDGKAADRIVQTLHTLHTQPNMS